VRRDDPRDAGVPHGGEVSAELDDGTALVADALALATGRTPAGCKPALSTADLHRGSAQLTFTDSKGALRA
jgi:hypothetical protein